jgi:integrase
MPRRTQLYQWRAEKHCYRESFTINGHRFRASLGTDAEGEASRRASIRFAAALKDGGEGQAYRAAVAETGGRPTVQQILPEDFTLDHVFGAYWFKHGQHIASADDIRRIGYMLLDGRSPPRDERGTDQRKPDPHALGRATLVRALVQKRIADYAAWRRAEVSNRTVNIELQHLRAVWNWAAENEGVPAPAIKWIKIFLEEPGEREHVLSAEEEARLFAALRPDYHPFVRFALLSGLRLSNVLGLQWRQIDRDAGVIWLRVKGGDQEYLPITPAMAAILDAERGHNFHHVFTYVCDRNRYDPHHGVCQEKGKRYPFAKNGWRKVWGRALAAAGIEDFRFHDLRHTAATRVLRVTGNLEVVKRMLHHKQISTTLRYAKSSLADVRAAMIAGQGMAPFLAPGQEAAPQKATKS